MNAVPDEVVRRYAYKRNLSLQEARIVFAALEQFLKEARLRKMSPPPAVDDAWHEFLLHSRLYYQYCEAQFGKIIHHTPRSPIVEDAVPELTARPVAGLAIAGGCDGGDCDSDSAD
ncbi:MAG TPA: hypothetical protein VF669_17390 [Tepidisphaeraceae bacterium]|jgi:hypothetical protein